MLKRARDGNIFVKIDEDCWDEVAKSGAASKRQQVIKCVVCGRAVVQLDNLYPYSVEDNRCEAHISTDISNKVKAIAVLYDNKIVAWRAGKGAKVEMTNEFFPSLTFNKMKVEWAMFDDYEEAGHWYRKFQIHKRFNGNPPY